MARDYEGLEFVRALGIDLDKGDVLSVTAHFRVANVPVITVETLPILDEPVVTTKYRLELVDDGD